jgi:quercetin dioxygenase-like cupin family protein
MSLYFPTPDEFSCHQPFAGITLHTCCIDKMTLSMATLDPHAIVPEHAHPHEQAGIVLEGSAIFSIGGEHKTLKPGDLFRIPGNIRHKVVVLDKPARILDIFSPVRDDYR